jgi:hypothetical protein
MSLYDKVVKNYAPAQGADTTKSGVYMKMRGSGYLATANLWKFVKEGGTNVWQAMITKVPSTKDLPEFTSARRKIRDMDMGVALRDFRFTPETKAERAANAAGRLEEMKTAGAQTAAKIAQGELPSGYYVMTDSLRAAGFMDPELTKQFGVYKVSSSLTESGQVAMNIVPQGAIGKLGKSFSATMNPEDVGQLMFNMAQTKATARQIRFQDLIMTHQRTMMALSGVTNDEKSPHEFLNPDGFKALLERGSVTTDDGGIVPKIRSRGIGGVYTKDAQGLYNRVMQGFVAPQNVAMSRAIYNTFETAFENQWQRLVKNGRIKGDPAQHPAMRAALRKKMWQRFMNPVLEAMQTSVNGLGMPHGADVLRREAFTGEGAFGFFRRHFENLEQQGQHMGLKMGTEEIPGGLESHIAQLTSREVFEMKQEGSKKVWTGKVNEFDEAAHVRARLRALDTFEKKTGIVAFGNGNIGGNREAAFDYLQERIKFFQSFEQKDGKSVPRAAKWKVSYSFQESNPLKGGGQGFGVWVHIAPHENAAISKGTGGAAQFFLPVEDVNGVFQTAGGSKYIGQYLGVSDLVLRQSGRGSEFLDDNELINQGLKYQTVHVRPETFNNYSEARKIAAQNRIQGGLHVFSATEVMFASVGRRMQRAVRKLDMGLFDQATSELGKGVLDATAEDPGIAISASAVQTQEQLLVHNALLLPESTINPIYAFATTDKSRINRDKFFRQFFQNAEDGRIEPKEGNAVAKALYESAGGDTVQEKFLNKEDERGGFEGSFANRIFNTIGSNTSVKNRQLQRIRTRLIQGSAPGQGVEGLAIIGNKAGRQGSPVAAAIYQDVVPGGNPWARPQQEFNAVPLRNSEDEIAMTQFQRVESRLGKEFADPTYQRNVGMGFIVGGEELDEAGNVVRTLGTDEMMQVMGAYEQQAIAKPEINEAFGAGANLHNMKIMADMSKNTVVINGGKTTWDDDFVKIFSGVPLVKTLQKHEGAGMLVRGQMNMMMARAGKDPQKALALQQGLQEIFDQLGLGMKFSIENGYVVNRAISGKHRFDETNVAKALEAKRMMNELGQKIDPSGGMELLQTTNFTSRSGNRYRVQYEQSMLATRVINDPSPTTDMTAEEALYAKHKRLNPKRNEAGMQAFDIKAYEAEGLLLQAENLKTSYLANPTTQKRAYKLHQYLSAYEANQNPMKFGNATGATEMTAEQIALREQAPKNVLSKDEYLARYGRGAQYIDIGNGRRLYAPDEIPDLTDVKGGGYRPSESQRALDRVIALSARIDPENLAHLDDLNKSIESYQQSLATQIKGKKGLLNNLYKSLDFSGKGFLKAPLQQSLWADDASFQPFSAKVSREFAKQIGAVPGQSLLKDERGQEFFWATVHRDPNAIYGRMGAKVYVDDTIKGFGLYVHDSLRKALYGDSDGDKVRVVLAGMLEGTKINRAIMQKLHGQFESAWTAKVAAWEGHEAALKEIKANLPKTAELFANFENYYHTNLPILKMSTMERILEQHEVDSAQGLIGAVTTPIQDRLMNTIKNTAASPEERELAALQYTGAGIIREEFLKVKGGNQFDPYAFTTLLQQQSVGKPVSVPGVAGASVIDKTQDLYDKKSGLLQTSAGSMNVDSYMDKYFLAGAKEDMEAGKDIWKYQALKAFTDMVKTGQAAEPKFDKWGKEISWFESFTEPVNWKSQAAMKNGAGPLDLANAGDWVRTITNPGKKVGRSAVDIFSRIFGRGAIDAAGTTEERMQEAQAASQALTEPKIGASIPESVLPETKDLTENMISAPVTQNASSMVEDGAKIAKKLSMSGVMEKLRNPWVMAGLGAGALATAAVTFGQSGEIRDAPEMPKPPTGGRTRVMSNDTGGSAQSYNIQVRASRNGDMSSPEALRAGISNAIGAQVNVDMQDARRTTRDRDKDASDQLKGRS